MADATQNLRDIISGFNSMAAQVGLLPTPGGAQGFGGPVSQAFQQTQTKHPGQVAQEMADQIRAQVQVAQQHSQVQNQFAADFSQRLQQIQQNYLPPQIAQYMAQTQGRGTPTMGMPGPGGIPSPIYQTPAAMAMYRPGLPANQLYAPGGLMQPQVPPAGFNAPMPAPFIPQPYMPLFPGGPQLGSMLPQIFGGQAPIGRFGEPWAREQMQQETMGNRAFAQAMAVTPTLAGTIPGALGGAALGARIGARGGLGGALIGGGIGLVGGGVGGAFAAEPLGLTRIGEAAVDPVVRQRAYGQQLEEMTRQFVVTGPQLHPLGRGLTQRAAVQTAGQMQKMVEGGEMSEFNMRDVMRITNIAGQRGMLDMAQSGEQISGQVRNIARAVRQFMMIVESPDEQQAMQSMASMRAMGLSVPETMVAARNAQMFSRMAGTTPQALMDTAGRHGGMMFQQAGLTGGLGAQAGMGAYGMARQAEAVGAYTPQQLALAGGRQGLAQTMMEGQAAMLNMRYPLMAMLTRGAKGELTIDQERMEALQSGSVSLSQQASGAATNISRLAQMGGVSQERVISEFTSRQRELADEMGRRLGPMGMQMMLIRQGMNVQREFGGNIGLGSALQQLGMGAQQARDLELMAGNRDVWRAAAQQVRADIPRMRQEEMERRQGVIDAGAAATRREMFRPVYEAGERLGRVGGGLSEMYRGWRTDVASWWTGGERTATGAQVVRPSERLSVEDRETQRALERRTLTDEGWQRARDAGRRLRSTRGETPVTGWEEVSSYYGGMKETGLTLLGAGGWGRAIGAAAGGMVLPEATAAGQSNLVQNMQARGGFAGQVAGFAPWAANLALGSRVSQFINPAVGVVRGGASVIEQARGGETFAAQYQREAEDVLKLGGAIRRGMTMEPGAMARAEEAQLEAFRTADRGKGGKGEMNADTMTSIVENMSRTLGKREELGKITGLGAVIPFAGRAKTLGEDEAKRHFIAAARREGVDEDAAAAQWDKGAREVVMGRLGHEGGVAARGALTTTQEATTGRRARNLQEAQEQAEQQTNITRAALGEGGAGGATAVGMAWGPLGALAGGVIDRATRISAKGVKGFEEFAIRTEDDNLMLLAVAQSLENKGGDDETVDKIRQAVKANLASKPNEYTRLKKEAAKAKNQPGDPEIQRALRQYGKAVANLSGEDMVTRTRKVRAGSADTREAVAMQRGATAIAAETGQDVNALLAEADTDKDLQKRIMARGREAGAEGVGGRGAGGDAERAARKQADRLEKFGEEAGRAAGLTGRDVQQFRVATEALLKSTEYLSSSAVAHTIGRATKD